MLHDNLEADFQTGAYDAGVLKLFNAVAAAAETYKSGNPTDSAAVGTASSAESTAGGTESSAAESSASSEASGPKGGSVIFSILKFVLVLVIVFAVLSCTSTGSACAKSAAKRAADVRNSAAVPPSRKRLTRTPLRVRKNRSARWRTITSTS